MIFRKLIKFKINKKLFKIKSIKTSDISKNYINSLNTSKYLRLKKKNTLISQRKYISKIKKSKNNSIVGIYMRNTLVGTMNSQIHKLVKIGDKKFKNAISFGILIFNKYQNKKIGKNSIIYYSKFLYKSYKNIFSTVHKRNFRSKKAFINSGFKEIYSNNETKYFIYKK